MFNIEFCTHCGVWQVTCPECGMGGCSGGHKYGCSLSDKELEISQQLDSLLRNTNLLNLLEKNV